MKDLILYEKKVDVLGVSKYDFTNDNGEVIRGCKLQVLSTSNSDNVIGSVVDTLNVDFNFYEKFVYAKFPCKCNIKFSIPNLTRKPVIEDIILL